MLRYYVRTKNRGGGVYVRVCGTCGKEALVKDQLMDRFESIYCWINFLHKQNRGWRIDLKEKVKRHPGDEFAMNG